MKVGNFPRILLASLVLTLFFAGPTGMVRAQNAKALNLQGCIDLAMANQPALAAARASLMAAVDGKKAVDGILFGRLLSPDLKYRREQACLGVDIASAGLQHAEWETRYAVTRNYYSVMYVREQAGLVKSVIDRIERARNRALELVKIGDPSIKVTQIDVDLMTLNLELIKTKDAEVTVGILKAMAALREAIGVGPDYPLALVEDRLPPLAKNLNKDDLVAQALRNRAEMSQASAAQQVTDLEISAQRSVFMRPTVRTFASASDIHAKPIPQGVSNGEYRPGAIGPEMPTILVGSRRDRVDRAGDFNERAMAVVSKTQNLIALEVEATYLKWLEAARKAENLEKAPAMAAGIYGKVKDRFWEGNGSGEEYLRTSNLEDQIRAQYNEALYMHALALAAMERVTAGGYRINAK